MKRFAFLTFILFLALAVQPLFYHALAVPPIGPLDGTRWDAIVVAHDSETGGILDVFPANLKFENDEVYFRSEMLRGRGFYKVEETRRGIMWLGKMMFLMNVAGDLGTEVAGVPAMIEGKALKSLLYNSGEINIPSIGLILKFRAWPMNEEPPT